MWDLLNYLRTKKAEQPLVRQLSYDGAGNPAISMKPLTLRESTHNVSQTTSMCWGCKEILTGKRLQGKGQRET